jgi:hypothetical protein
MCVYGGHKIFFGLPLSMIGSVDYKGHTLIINFLILFEVCVGSKLDGLERVMGDVGCQLEASLILVAPCVSRLSQLLWPGLYKCLGALVCWFELCSI